MSDLEEIEDDLSEQGEQDDQDLEEDVPHQVGISQVLEEEQDVKRQKKRTREPTMTQEEEDRTKELEEELFGTSSFLQKNAEGEEGQQELHDRAHTTETLSTAGGVSFVIDDGPVETEPIDPAHGGGERRPVWVDEDDLGVNVDIAAGSRRRKLRHSIDETVVDGEVFSERLRKQFVKVQNQTEWAQLSKTVKNKQAVDEEDGPEHSILQTTGGLLAEKPSFLPPKLIEATRLKDANEMEPSKAVIQSVEFHPDSLLMLTAGFDKMLRLFSIDGVHNKKVRGAFFEDTPIRKASFLNRDSIIVSGRRPFYYKFNIESGKIDRISHVSGFEKSSFENFAVSQDSQAIAFLSNSSNIALVSSRSNRKIAELHVDSKATTAAFISDKEFMATTVEGAVYKWDLRTYRCLDRFQDEGNLKGTSIACSGQGRYAIGSESGVVNIYTGKPSSLQKSYQGPRIPQSVAYRKPDKAIMNLTTKVDNLQFNSDGSILAISSTMKRDALRLVHTASSTVFSNWPTSKTPLHYVHSCAFSPGSGYFAVGNARGRVLLYRLHHFPQE